MLAINRTFDEEALRAGLKNHTLDSVMFPARPHPQRAADSQQSQPRLPAGQWPASLWSDGPDLLGHSGTDYCRSGRGVGVWRPTTAADSGPGAAILPKRENDLVRLQMDAIGVLDFDQGTAALDATLYDSRLLKKFVLTGDMAMRLKWEGSPNFALAVGGLHPAFNPPPNFPKLERIAINLSAGDNPRLRCEAYFALTSNTVQFGARAELYAAAAGFSVHGDIGFDVLIQFDPFSFLADFMRNCNSSAARPISSKSDSKARWLAHARCTSKAKPPLRSSGGTFPSASTRRWSKGKSRPCRNPSRCCHA